MMVPNPEYLSVDLHQQTAFVKLGEADDGVAKLRVVVDTTEHPVLAGLDHELDGADVADLH